MRAVLEKRTNCEKLASGSCRTLPSARASGFWQEAAEIAAVWLPAKPVPIVVAEDEKNLGGIRKIVNP